MIPHLSEDSQLNAPVSPAHLFRTRSSQLRWLINKMKTEGLAGTPQWNATKEEAVLELLASYSTAWYSSSMPQDECERLCGRMNLVFRQLLGLAFLCPHANGAILDDQLLELCFYLDIGVGDLVIRADDSLNVFDAIGGGGVPEDLRAQLDCWRVSQNYESDMAKVRAFLRDPNLAGSLAPGVSAHHPPRDSTRTELAIVSFDVRQKASAVHALLHTVVKYGVLKTPQLNKHKVRATLHMLKSVSLHYRYSTPQKLAFHTSSRLVAMARQLVAVMSLVSECRREVVEVVTRSVSRSDVSARDLAILNDDFNIFDPYLDEAGVLVWEVCADRHLSPARVCYISGGGDTTTPYGPHSEDARAAVMRESAAFEFHPTRNFPLYICSLSWPTSPLPSIPLPELPGASSPTLRPLQERGEVEAEVDGKSQAMEESGDTTEALKYTRAQPMWRLIRKKRRALRHRRVLRAKRY